MNLKQDIWTIIREVYGIGRPTPSDLQSNLIDKLTSYMNGTYQPPQPTDVVEVVEVEKKQVVMVTAADGTQKPRGRGRPKKS